MEDAPMLTTPRGKPDTTARHVLQVLAERADSKGRDAFPSVLDIEYRTGYDRRTVQRALKRLEADKLITRDGQRYGQPNYVIDLSRRRPASDRQSLYDAYERDRLSAAERKRRSRSKAVPPDDTDDDAAEDVTHSECVGHALEVRDVTHFKSGRHALNAAHNHPLTTHQPSRTAVGEPSDPSDPQSATAHPSLRSGRLLLEPSADRHRPEDHPPVVGTATIPVGERDHGSREKSAGELQREREIHNQGCGRCQNGRGACSIGADLIRQWMRALNREAG